MFNRIGLTTPRGSGTNGYIQTNKFFVKPRSGRADTSAPSTYDLDAATGSVGGVEKPNKAILEHDRKRRIELRLLSLRETLADQGYTDAEIENKAQETRKALEAEAAAAALEGSRAMPPPSKAFRSTTRRSAVGSADDAGSSTHTPVDGRRRYRSLSRGPGRFPPSTPEHDDFSTPRGRFVNKARGSGTGFPEISLDDLADEFFWARGKEEEGEIGRRSGRRVSDVSPRAESGLSRVRGRSQSKYFAAPETAKGGDGGPRRRRSVSVARNRCSDGENDMDLSRSSVAKNKSRSSVTSNFQQTALEKPNTLGRVLRRSMSQKDLFQAPDSYSSYSSSLTDDEACEGHTNKNGTEKTIQAVYSLEKMDHPTGDGEATGFYEAMRKEVRNAVGEIRTELEKVMVKPGPASVANGDGGEPKSSKVIEVIADIRNCTTKLEQSEKRKQELLAELAVEEQRGQELTKIVRELLPESKENTTRERASRPRRRSNDRTMMSKRLDEEAERYFDEFLSNVEDTDVSSFDGERSDTSSVIGGNARRNFGVLNAVLETHVDLIKAASVPVETDEVTFPWLQWETSTDITHSPSKNKMRVPLELGNTFSIPTQDASLASEWCIDRRESFGSSSSVLKDVRVCRREVGRDQSERKESTFDMDEYLLLQQNEELLFESLRQRQRIESGSLVVCRRSLI